ncbi:MAG: hypothetical protein ACYSUF_07675 [Planctomycetota bacterium]
MKTMRMTWPRHAFAAMLLAGVLVAAASSTLQEGPAGEKPDPWQPLRFFAGRWEGTGEGRWGHSTVEREYEFVLGGKFLFARNKSVYPPQEKNPEGEVHRVYDRAHRELHSRLEGPRDLPHPRPGRIRGGLRAGGARG